MKYLNLIAGLLVACVAAAKVDVKSVTAQQRYPWNGLVDIAVTVHATADDLAGHGFSFAATNRATKAVVPITRITQNGADTGAETTWTRKFIWNAVADIGNVKIEDLALAVEVKELGGVQLWENGPYWAECNVGASQPEEYGYYFWWGDTEGYMRSGGTWSSEYLYFSDVTWLSGGGGLMTSSPFTESCCSTYGKDNSVLQSDGYIDSTNNLVSAYDAATAHLGAPWRMPTDAEWSLMILNCDTTWTARNGVYGWMVRGVGAYASKSIFLPAAGFCGDSVLCNPGSCGMYWSSTTPSDDSYVACILDFDSRDFRRAESYRWLGHPIRPIRGFAKRCTVLFDANGGSVSEASRICVCGATVGELPVAKRVGFAFNGWYTDSCGGEQVTAATIVTNDVACYAKWTELDGVQLWENGPYWSECNVGASQPEEYGYYFWWGDTIGYKRSANDDGWESSKTGLPFAFTTRACQTFGVEDLDLLSAGYIDSSGNLVAAHDAAAVHLGAPWRMPTSAEIDALISNCTSTWTNRNGVAGRLVTGQGAYASKSIFLPAAGDGRDSELLEEGSCGDYWSSTLKVQVHSAIHLDFGSLLFQRNDRLRYRGQTVRPVRDGAKSFTLHFDANGGSALEASRVCDYGAHIGDLPIAKLDGYTFNGWYTDLSGGEQVTATTIVTNDVTYYAQWTWESHESDGVQLWENGPYWAECNVGASQPEGYGYYFWWGDTVGYTRSGGVWTDDYYYSGVTWVSSVGSRMISSPFTEANCPTFGKDSSELQSAGYIDSTGSLVAAHDAATVHLGAPWRMPTFAEYAALIRNCTTTFTKRNGVVGELVTGRGKYASKSVFFPAAGYGDHSCLYNNLGQIGFYYSSTLDSDFSGGVWQLCIGRSCFDLRAERYSWPGLSVRPVREPTEQMVAVNSGVTASLAVDCRTGARSCAEGAETLFYNAAWYENTTRVEVCDGSAKIAEGTTGSVVWHPETSDSHTLKLIAYDSAGTSLVEESVLRSFSHFEVVTAEAKAATCTEDGCTKGAYCSQCNAVLSTTQKIAALGHDPQTTLAAVEATCTTAGHTKEIACSRCGMVFQESETIPAGHLWTVTKPAVPATSGTTGSTEEISCSRCGEVQQAATVIPALGYVRNVKAQQLWPHRKVEVCYFLADDIGERVPGDTVADLSLTYSSMSKTAEAASLLGDKSCEAGFHRLVWDFEKQGLSLDQDMTFTVKYGTVGGVTSATNVKASSGTCYNGMSVSGNVELGYSPIDAQQVQLNVDGEALLSATNSGSFVWQPTTTGTHTLEHIAGTNHWTRTVNVTSVAYAQPVAPNPPTEEDANITIGSTAKSVASTGGTVSIGTSGSGTWVGNVSDDWIVFKGNSSKAAGQFAVVTVSANTGAEARTGYVYISGHVFTITQAGVGAELESYSVEFGPEGGAGEVLVLADGQSAWNVKAESEWISVAEVSGLGEAYVHYSVAPYADVSDRTGYITIAGRSFEVHQVGRAMSILRQNDSFDYLSHAVEIDVSALMGTEWFVTPMASWISIVSPASGIAQGSGKVLLTVNENPSYLARSGYVTIGTVRYDVAQEGRPSAALAFAISPEATTASVNGANGLIAVTATPDLPWTAESQVNWLTVMPTMKEGSGNGNVVYTATPNSTMAARTGTIKVAAEAASGMGTRTHSVSQPAAVAAIAVDAHTFAAEGDSFEVAVTIGDNVNWTISKSASWVSVDGTTSRIGPGTVKIAVSENQDIDPRTTTVTIAGHAFAVTQRGRTVEVEYTSRVFDAEGGDGAIEVHPNGTVNWTAVSSADWLTIWAEDGASDNTDGSVSGSGDGTIGYYVNSYVGDGESLTASITIGDKVVYITQRAYAASISPTAATVGGNAGSGEFGFSADIDDVWNALNILCSQDWVETVQVTSFDATTKSGTIRYTYRANDSGVARSGMIVVAGEAYQLTQNARQLARIQVEVEGEGGGVTGEGVYDVGTSVVLVATPTEGYRFTGWTGASSATTATLRFSASVDRSYTAHFERIPVYTVNGETVREGTVVTCTAPSDQIDAAGTTKLVCLGTSAYPDKGTSFTLVASEDVSFEWDLWQTNYLLSVEALAHGQVGVTVLGESRTLPCWMVAGEEVTLTATPDTRYEFFRWMGISDGVFSMDGPKTVKAVFGIVGSLAQTLDAVGFAFRTGGDGTWATAADARAIVGYTAACATAGPNSDTWLEMTVAGTGTLSFSWRAECEHDDSSRCEWDRLAVFMNGVEVARIDGVTDYQRVELPIDGRTVIRWSFYRDEHDAPGSPSEPKVWIDGISVSGDIQTVSSLPAMTGVQLWKNGPYWAECNVGASKPEEYGYYFWWGDTVGYQRKADDDGWEAVKTRSAFTFVGDNCLTYSVDNADLQSAGYIDSTGSLVAKYDAATSYLGSPWRMPTDAEYAAMISNCTAMWTTRNGVYGRLVTGKGAYASRSIFLPAAGYGNGSGLSHTDSFGYYWSSTPHSNNSVNAWDLYFGSGSFYRGYNYRCFGRSVRPVRGSAQ